MINTESLTLCAILFQLYGSFLLTIQATNIKWVHSAIDILINFSNYLEAKKWRIVVFIILIILLLICTLHFLPTQYAIAISLPSIIVLIFFVQIFENPASTKTTILKFKGDLTIFSKSFILIAIGSALLLIATIMQIGNK